jgi:hypothetical protein
MEGKSELVATEVGLVNANGPFFTRLMEDSCVVNR